MIYDEVYEDKESVISIIRYESYALFSIYLIFAGICWFIFWHHPSHIGIKIRASAENSNSFGFVVDNTTSFWNPKDTAISQGSSRPAFTSRRNINSTLIGTQTQTQSMIDRGTVSGRFAGGSNDDIAQDNYSNDSELVKMDVTLIDAFKIKEINLLIASYLFAMCHNVYILKSSQYSGIELDVIMINAGSIAGVICSGILVDIIYKKRHFLTIALLNVIIFAFDIYLYT